MVYTNKQRRTKMTKKKRVIVSLSEEAYEYLRNLIGITLNINGKSYAIDSKSKAVEKLLLEVKEQDKQYDKSKK